MAVWHVASGGHLRRSVVIGVVARQRVTSSGAFMGALSFGVPRESALINRKLIPRKCISFSFLHRSCLSSSIFSTFPTSRQLLLPLCCSTSSPAVFQLAYLGTCISSSPFTESTFQVHSSFFSNAPNFLFFLDCVVGLQLGTILALGSSDRPQSGYSEVCRCRCVDFLGQQVSLVTHFANLY